MIPSTWVKHGFPIAYTCLLISVVLKYLLRKMPVTKIKNIEIKASKSDKLEKKANILPGEV